MGRTSRTVQRLHLCADSESAVRRALPLLEDAFRSATLPDDGARLVFVRTLNLGRLPRGASAQSLSLLLETRFAEADWNLVHAGDDVGAAARAVWFRDSLEAHALAALRVARERPVDGWFWPLAVPALAGAASPADRIRAIAFSLAAQEEAASALPVWVDTLVRAGHREQLIAALRPGDGRALLHAAGVRGFTTDPRADSGSGTIPGATRAAQERDRPRPPRTQRRAKPPSAEYDDRVELVEQMLRLTQSPSLSQDRPHLTIERDGVETTSVARVPRPRTPTRAVARPRWRDPMKSSDSPLAHPGAHPEPKKSHSAGSRREAEEPPDSRRASAPIRGPLASEIRRGVGADSPTEVVQTPASPWAFPAAAPTAAGGLVFLLPVLERLGFAEWCRTRPAGDPPPATVVRQIFHLLLTRLRIAADDPAWELALNFRLKAEATNEETGGFLQAQEAIARGWLTACRRLLRRRARIGLATLVVRPARLAVTATHVGVFFRLSAADLRIRRAGLDIDPGWVPWFARVVTFHYQDSPWT